MRWPKKTAGCISFDWDFLIWKLGMWIFWGEHFLASGCEDSKKIESTDVNERVTDFFQYWFRWQRMIATLILNIWFCKDWTLRSQNTGSCRLLPQGDFTREGARSSRNHIWMILDALKLRNFRFGMVNLVMRSFIKFKIDCFQLHFQLDLPKRTLRKAMSMLWPQKMLKTTCPVTLYLERQWCQSVESWMTRPWFPSVLVARPIVHEEMTKLVASLCSRMCI